MKIRTTKSPIKTLAIIGSAIVVLALGWLYYAHHYQRWPFAMPANTEKPANTVDYNKATDDQTKNGTTIKEQVAEQAKNSDNPQPSPSGVGADVAMDITAANKNGDTLMVRTLIQKVTSAGTCTLSMKGPNNGTYSASAEVQAMASTSTCKGFNVPLSGLAHGSWMITVTFDDGESNAVATKEVAL